MLNSHTKSSTRLSLWHDRSSRCKWSLPPDVEGSCEYTGKQALIAEKEWSSILEVGQEVNNSPQGNQFGM